MVVPVRAPGVKMVGMVEMRTPISLDGVEVHLDCWCVCLCYLHFAPENLEGGKMYFLILAHPGCPRQGPESHKMVVVVVVVVQVNLIPWIGCPCHYSFSVCS